MANKNQSSLTSAEIAYLQSQRMARIATVGSNGQPHVVPVAFRYNPETKTIDIGGHDGFAKRKKWRDVMNNPKVAVVIDDIVSVNPWKVRGIEIRGEAEMLMTGGQSVVPSFDPEMFRIKPKRVISWGINPETQTPVTK
ncbi:MAG: PPOX class F420-dependent oxidoreductase [Anaerolineales bacterium]